MIEAARPQFAVILAERSVLHYMPRRDFGKPNT